MQPPLTGDHSSSVRVNDCRCMINQFYTEQGKWATIIQEKCVVHQENVRKKFPVFLLLHLNFIDLLQQHWTQNTQEDDQYSNEMILTSDHPCLIQASMTDQWTSITDCTNTQDTVLTGPPWSRDAWAAVYRGWDELLWDQRVSGWYSSPTIHYHWTWNNWEMWGKLNMFRDGYLDEII